jgi:hypothetical protein
LRTDKAARALMPHAGDLADELQQCLHEELL